MQELLRDVMFTHTHRINTSKLKQLSAFLQVSYSS